MEERKKNLITIGIIVGCLVIAVAVTFFTRRTSHGIDSIKKGDMIWVKCYSTDCKAEYQIEKRDYFEFLQKNANPMAMRMPPMECEKCSQKSIYRAVKCEECDTIFFYGEIADQFKDKCPKCGFSKTESLRNQ